MRFAVVVLAACTASSAPAPKPLPPPQIKPDQISLSPDDRVAELAFLRDAIRDSYAHLETKQQQWHFELGALYARYERSIRAADTWTAFEGVMVSFVAELHDGHVQWRRKRATTEGKRKTMWLGLDTRFVGDALVVVDVWPGSGAERAGVKRGDELTAIDGVPIAKRFEDWSRIRSWARPEVARYDFQAAWRSTRVPEGAAPPVHELTRAGGDRLQVSVEPKVDRKPKPAFELEWRGDVAVLHVRSLRPHVADTQKRAAEAAAAIYGQAKGLVIDLRDNDGGYEDGARAIAAQLTAKQLTAGTTRVRLSPASRAANKQWRELAEDPAKPGWSQPQPIAIDGKAPREYPEKIAVEIDAGCRSSCETLALAMRAVGARLVGDTTGGSGGAPITITLPKTGARVELPVRASFDTAGKPIEGFGVAPDEVIVPARADLLAGRDAVHERAVALVCTKPSGC